MFHHADGGCTIKPRLSDKCCQGHIWGPIWGLDPHSIPRVTNAVPKYEEKRKGKKEKQGKEREKKKETKKKGDKKERDRKLNQYDSRGTREGNFRGA